MYPVVGLVTSWRKIANSPRLVDGAIVCLLAALILREMWTSDFVTGPLWIHSLVAVIGVLALLFRRSASLAVVTVVISSLIVERFLVPGRAPDEVFVGWLIAIYSVGLHRDPRRGLVGLSIAMVGAVAWLGGDDVLDASQLSLEGRQPWVHRVEADDHPRSGVVELLEGAPELFGDGRSSRRDEGRPDEQELYEQIGRLKMEVEWLKKKAAQLG